MLQVRWSRSKDSLPRSSRVDCHPTSVPSPRTLCHSASCIAGLDISGYGMYMYIYIYVYIAVPVNVWGQDHVQRRFEQVPSSFPRHHGGACKFDKFLASSVLQMHGTYSSQVTRQVSYQWFLNLLYFFQDRLEAPTLPNWRFDFRNYILRQMKQQLHLGKANTSECKVYMSIILLASNHDVTIKYLYRKRESFKWTYEVHTK